MIRQLRNFKDRVRGAHPDDVFGPSMSSMASYLRNEQSIADVAAYVTTLAAETGQSKESLVQIETDQISLAGGG